MIEKYKGTRELQLTLESLTDGTWAYIIDLFGRDSYGRQESLTPEETQAKLNDALGLVNKQGGRVVQLLEVDVKGQRRGGIAGNPVEKGYFLIVQK